MSHNRFSNRAARKITRELRPNFTYLRIAIIKLEQIIASYETIQPVLAHALNTHSDVYHAYKKQARRSYWRDQAMKTWIILQLVSVITLMVTLMIKDHLKHAGKGSSFLTEILMYLAIAECIAFTAVVPTGIVELRHIPPYENLPAPQTLQINAFKENLEASYNHLNNGFMNRQRVFPSRYLQCPDEFFIQAVAIFQKLFYPEEALATVIRRYVNLSAHIEDFADALNSKNLIYLADFILAPEKELQYLNKGKSFLQKFMLLQHEAEAEPEMNSNKRINNEKVISQK